MALHHGSGVNIDQSGLRYRRAKRDKYTAYCMCHLPLFGVASKLVEGQIWPACLAHSASGIWVTEVSRPAMNREGLLDKSSIVLSVKPDTHFTDLCFSSLPVDEALSPILITIQPLILDRIPPLPLRLSPMTAGRHLC